MITRVSGVTSIEGKWKYYCVCWENFFPNLREFKVPTVVVRFVEFICCRIGECEEVIVVFVAEAGPASRGHQEDNRIQIGADH